MKRQTRLLIAASLIAALLSACSTNDGGQWVQLPGGRIEHTLPVHEPDTENLIYKIDDHRYFTMLTVKGDCKFGGPIWYHDTQRNIHSEAADRALFRFPYSIDGDQYLAIPSNRAIESVFSSVYFSTDYGQTWRRTLMSGDGPSAFTKGIFIKYTGYSSEGKPERDTVGFYYLNIAHILTLEGEKPKLNGIGTGGFHYNRKERKSFYIKEVRNAYGIPNALIGVPTPTDFDVSAFFEIKTPSGWTRFRCDPMPKDLQGALR